MNSYLKPLATHLKICPNSISADYKKWRHRFLLERLHLTVWIALIAHPAFLIMDLVIAAVHNAAGNFSEGASSETLLLWLIEFIAVELCLLLCLTLLRIPWARRYPELLFLGFSWSKPNC